MTQGPLEGTMESTSPVCVTSDKLLLTMLIGKPQLQDLNPDILQPASPQDQLPSHLQISGLEPEQDSTSGNLLRLDELKVPASRFPTPRVPVDPANEREGQAKDHRIAGASTERETKKLPVEHRSPRDDQPHNLIRKFEYSQFKPANELTPAIDATED
ncbi:hypothetical protein DSO57_1033043 [Entomophthora muscae]|uniref:Uncharacterized protein n=1 Tax=Entomophthora muscae TaxID=34485 RepID=A0ACC2RR82_9FUNG|nr:hypothetical protein DSO57_1033043 [Entomophthora muscae]